MKIFSLALISVWLSTARAIDMTIGDDASMKQGLQLIAKGLMDYYWGSQHGGIVGMMVPPYYWWEAGAAWGSMLDYWYYTGDDTYNDILKQSLIYQTGQNQDYMPSNQTTTEGNDDQGFWGITAMAAAERNFSNPKPDEPQWLSLAQAVFNTMTTRWDTQHCGGGLRWQIYTWNNGYDYKNTVANGCLFNLAARLARYTGNQTYSDWAEKVFDWVTEVQYLRSDYKLYDGGLISDNCSSHTEIQWTYNYGLFISGSAYMYNMTGDQKWLDRVTGLWQQSGVFFQNGVMYEAACQPSGRCNNDQRSFKGIFSRFLGLTARLVPTVADDIMQNLKTSAQAAALSCSGGSDGHTCGLNWFNNNWDGVYGLGEQMSALEVIQNNMVLDHPMPFTNKTGGSSKGNPDAGSKSSSNPLRTNELDIGGGGRAGAAILTLLVLAWVLGTAYWMLR